MFAPEFFIDSFQSTKKIIVRRMTDDKELQAIADRYVDAQTQFAKMVISNSIDITKYSFNKISNCIFDTKKSEVSAPTKETN